MLRYEDLHEYQQGAITHLYEHDHALALLPMGAGKTVIAATAAQELLDDGAVKRWLIVAPKRVCQLVWPPEARKWYHLVETPEPALGDSARRAMVIEGTSKMVCINYENLAWFFETFGGAHDFNGLILDEVSRMKNPSAVRFKALKKYLAQFKVRWGLTGTPTSNGVEDLFGQVYCIDGGRRLGLSRTKFRQDHYEQFGPMPWQWRPKKTAVDDITTAMADIAYQIPDEAYADQLPPLVENIITVDLPGPVREQYDELEEEYVAQFGDEEVIAPNGGALVNKLQQIANGFIYGEDKAVEWLHDEKLDALDEVADAQQGAPLLVAYKYRAELALLMARHKTSYLGAGVTDKQAETRVETWNEGNWRTFFVHPASAGHGLNLQAGGNTVCWYGLTWSLEEHDQTIARLRRQGQEADQVWCHYIVARDTIDEDILRALQRKEDVDAAVVAGIRARRST